MFAKEDIQKAEEAERRFHAALKNTFFPTIGSVISLSSETSKAMRVENRQRQIEAFRKRTKRGTRAYKFSRKA